MAPELPLSQAQALSARSLRRHLLFAGAVATLALVQCLATGKAAAADGSPGSDVEGDRSFSPVDDDGTILVRGERIRFPAFDGIPPEDELSAEDIAAYGANSVGELLEILGDEADPTGAGPVVLVNGRQVNGLRDVADLPTEAVVGVQLLPGEAAARLGQSGSRRVISVVLKTRHSQATALAERTLTDQGGGAALGEVNLVRIAGKARDSLVLRVRDQAALAEDERDVRADALAQPYALAGNLLSAGAAGSAIDPALSTAFGGPVTVVGLPGTAGKPTLAQLLAGANRPNASAAGAARTLQAAVRTWSANGNVTRPLGAGTVAFSSRAEWIDSDALGGLYGTLVQVPAGSPFAPVASSSAIARFADRPLENGTASFNLDAGANLQMPLGGWQLTGLAELNHRINHGSSDLGYDLTSYLAGVAAGTADPFAPLVVGAGQVLRNETRFRSNRGELQAIASGRLVDLPAGAVQVTMRASFERESTRSTATSGGTTRERTYERNEGGLRAGLQVPLLAGGSRGGAVGLDLAGAVRRTAEVAEPLLDYEASLQWLATGWLNLRGSAKHEKVVPAAGSRSDPVQLVENQRTYDFATGETVLVRYLTGGNPDLPIAERSTLTATANVTLTRRLKMVAEFSHRIGRDVQGSLPPNSASVQATFADRFLRDAGGRLVQVDGRPVSFFREAANQAHWGLDLRTTLGRSGAIAARSGAGGADGAQGGFTGGRAMRLQVSFDHYWLLSSTRQARPGAQVVDMLAGGAAGYGSGVARHTLRLSASAAKSGMGLQASASWRSRNTIRVADVPSAGDLAFSAHGTLTVRAYADLGTLFPRAPVLKGTRLALVTENVFAAFQRVTDGTGQVPQRYQPALLDPLGRNYTLSLRKVF